jgi:Flp pilus assembly pilin Flp
MADRGTLGAIGYGLCAVTIAVAMIAALVVMDHVSGRLAFDGDGLDVPAASTQTAIRAIPASLR